MHKQFTEASKRVVFRALESAKQRGRGVVTGADLLLALTDEDARRASHLLSRLRIDVERLRAEVGASLEQGTGRTGGDYRLEARARRSIDLAYDEARQLDSESIGTDHLLLGLIREAEGPAGRLLARLGADLSRARELAAEVEPIDEGVPAPTLTTQRSPWWRRR